MPRAVARRWYPMIGAGGGVPSFVHLDDAAAATVLALDHDGPAIYNITDDEPAPMCDWLPALAEALGAKPPRRVPVWLARVGAGDALEAMAAQSRGPPNAQDNRRL